MVASRKRHTAIVKLLLAVPGLNVNAAKVSCVSGKHPHAAISHRYVRCEPVVLQYDGRTALMVACEKGHTAVAKLLVADPGLNVNAAKVSRVSGRPACCNQSYRCERFTGRLRAGRVSHVWSIVSAVG